MAAVTHRNSTASTANASSYASGSFTPAAGELLFAFVTTSATIAGGTMSDSQSLGFSLVGKALKATSLDTIYFFVANKLAAASSMTVTFECVGDAATSALIQVGGISSMTRLGFDAVRQFKVTNNGAAAGTPAATFDVSALTGNPTLGVVGNASNPAAMTPPTNWTELNDTGIDTPNTGAEYVHRDSGFTGTTITWGGTSATAFGVIIAEMDTSAIGPEPQFKSLGTMATGTGTAATSNMPADWDAGDIMFLSLGLSLTTPTTSDPSGWTKVPGGSEGNPIDGATDVRHYLWYRVAQGGDTAPSLTLSISDDWETLMFNYSPVDGTTPINASAGDDFADTTGTSFTTVSITPTVANTRIVVVAFTDKTTTPAIPLYSFNGSNERAKLEGNSALMFGLADKIGPAADVAVTQSFIISSTDFPAVFIIAVAPESGTTYTQGCTATLTLTPSVIKSPNKIASASLALTASVVKNTNKIRSATLTLTPTALKNTNKSAQAVVTLTASAVKNTNKFASATLSFLASVATQFNSGSGQVFTQAVTATITLTSSVQRAVGKRATAALTLTPTVTRAVGKRVTAALTLTPSVSRGMHKAVSAALALNASVTKGTHKAATAALTLTATVTKATSKVLSAALTLTGTVASVFRVYVPHVIGQVVVSIFPVGQAEGSMITVGKAEGSVVKTGDIGVEVIEG